MCEKIISKGCALSIDPCLVEELERIQSPYFKRKFKPIMSCCGHGKYSKTFIVQNKGSGYFFEWFSGISLTGTRRQDSRAPFYKRDAEGFYYIPEINQRVD